MIRKFSSSDAGQPLRDTWNSRHRSESHGPPGRWMGSLGNCQSERIRNWWIVLEVSRLDRRLNGRAKIYFAASSIILDLPVPELWTMGTKLSYMRRSRSVFIIWTAWTKSLSPLYSMSHTLFATEQKMNISEDATGNNCPPSASEFRDQQRTLLIKKQQLYLKTTLIMQSHLEEMMSGSKIQLSANGVLNYCQIETPWDERL